VLKQSFAGLIRNRIPKGEETAVSRKANRKSGERPGRRKTRPGTAEKPKPWAFLVGIVLAPLALFLAEATLREIFIGLHRDDYVRDVLEVSSLSSPDDEASLHGQIASTGESFTVPVSVVGPDFLDRFRELQREGRMKGHRVPVWYLPQATPWWWWGASKARVINVSQSGDRFGVWRIAVAINVPLAVGSVFLILHGLKQIRVRERRPTG
jgi:hypothetical protein